jgi:hypothetical protein
MFRFLNLQIFWYARFLFYSLLCRIYQNDLKPFDVLRQVLNINNSPYNTSLESQENDDGG